MPSKCSKPELNHKSRVDELAAILAKGVIRYVRRMNSSTSESNAKKDCAAKKELLAASAHGSLSRELTNA